MQTEPASPTVETATGGCPYHTSQQKTAPSGLTRGTGVSQDADGVWHVRSFDAARAVLRSSNVKQAGFQAEVLGDALKLMRDPMLYLEGKEHIALRKQTARFFTPKAVRAYDDMIVSYVDDMLDTLKRAGRLDLSDLTMKLAVRVAAEVVGLTSSDMDGMANRIGAFFEMDAIDPAAPWSIDKLRGLATGQYHTMRFYWQDVRPAIAARKAQPQEDLITHLLGQEYKNMEIMTECVTFGAAGMVTTREFIAAAAWHFLQNETLRDDYLAASQADRFEMLHEILRLEPVVGNLYRRTTAPIDLAVGDETVTIPADALIDVHIYGANDDSSVLGDPTGEVCPHRDLPRGVQSYGLSFGDGNHRCPGAYIAIEETDIFMTRFLKLDNLRMVREPDVTYNDVVKGYELRNFIVAVD